VTPRCRTGRQIYARRSPINQEGWNGGDIRRSAYQHTDLYRPIGRRCRLQLNRHVVDLGKSMSDSLWIFYHLNVCLANSLYSMHHDFPVSYFSQTCFPTKFAPQGSQHIVFMTTEISTTIIDGSNGMYPTLPVASWRCYTRKKLTNDDSTGATISPRYCTLC